MSELWIKITFVLHRLEENQWCRSEMNVPLAPELCKIPALLLNGEEASLVMLRILEPEIR